MTYPSFAQFLGERRWSLIKMVVTNNRFWNNNNSRLFLICWTVLVEQLMEIIKQQIQIPRLGREGIQVQEVRKSSPMNLII
mmetsp:Transcript_12720/g.18703  ORF Transcript_12720/g.18703 Transcript_12720/m.18703 type:complete len:81 (-) Transcript_12720:570-812(-)